MKRTLWLSMILALALLLFACAPSPAQPDHSDSNPAAPSDSSAGKSNDSGLAAPLKVTVTTSFLEDMVSNLAGPLAQIELIIPAGSDPHLYTAKPEDLKKIQNADLLLYHGLHFEGKMIDILEQKGKAVAARFPEKKIGRMEEDGAEVIDPHFWFDIDLYENACETAALALSEALPSAKDQIQENLKKYLGELDQLKASIEKDLEAIPKEHRYLVTPHDAFNYFARAFHFTVVAPQGVSTDSEVASADVEEVVNTIVKHKIKAIFAESTTDPARMKKIQETCAAKGFEVRVISGEGQELFSDSLAPKGQSGDSYLTMYRHNIDLIVGNLK